jgi:hypothetical protein
MLVAILSIATSPLTSIGLGGSIQNMNSIFWGGGLRQGGVPYTPPQPDAGWLCFKSIPRIQSAMRFDPYGYQRFPRSGPR